MKKKTQLHLKSVNCRFQYFDHGEILSEKELFNLKFVYENQIGFIYKYIIT